MVPGRDSSPGTFIMKIFDSGIPASLAASRAVSRSEAQVNNPRAPESLSWFASSAARKAMLPGVITPFKRCVAQAITGL